MWKKLVLASNQKKLIKYFANYDLKNFIKFSRVFIENFGKYHQKHFIKLLSLLAWKVVLSQISCFDKNFLEEQTRHRLSLTALCEKESCFSCQLYSNYGYY